MRKTCYCFLLAAWTLTGCVPQALVVQPAASPPAAPIAETSFKPAPPPVIVKAEDVTETNAREMAKALWDELDREAQSETPAKEELKLPAKKP